MAYAWLNGSGEVPNYYLRHTNIAFLNDGGEKGEGKREGVGGSARDRARAAESPNNWGGVMGSTQSLTKGQVHDLTAALSKTKRGKKKIG